MIMGYSYQPPSMPHISGAECPRHINRSPQMTNHRCRALSCRQQQSHCRCHCHRHCHRHINNDIDNGQPQTVPRLLLVNSSWKEAVAPDQERLYKLLVRRSGVTPRRRAAFWEFMVLRRCEIATGWGEGGRVASERLIFVRNKGENGVDYAGTWLFICLPPSMCRPRGSDPRMVAMACTGNREITFGVHHSSRVALSECLLIGNRARAAMRPLGR